LSRLRFLRIERGWTLQELAEAAGTTPTQISRLETGKRRLTEEWIYKLAQALNVDPSRLITDNEDEDLKHFFDSKIILDAYKSVYDFPSEEKLPPINRELLLICSDVVNSNWMRKKTRESISPNDATIVSIILHDSFINIYSGIKSGALLVDAITKYEMIVSRELKFAKKSGEIPEGNMISTRPEWVAMFDLYRQTEDLTKRQIDQYERENS